MEKISFVKSIAEEVWGKSLNHLGELDRK